MPYYVGRALMKLALATTINYKKKKNNNHPKKKDDGVYS
jgi:hypothetical protein